MDLNEINVYVEVVKAGSFGQAAKKLGMPNSTVSAKVSSLEKRLGVTLIQRTTRKLNITPAGQSFFKRCLQGIESIQTAEDELATQKGEPQGLLRVTAPIELGGSVLPEVVALFMARYPKVKVELLLTERRVDLLGESIDLAIRAGELKDSGLIAKRIGVVFFSMLAGPKYLKQRGAPAHPKEIAQHDTLHFSPIGPDEWKLVGPKGTCQLALTPKIVANDFALLKKLALKNEGICFLPSHICQDEFKSGALVRVLPEWRSALAPVHFVYPAQKFVTPKLSAFMELALPLLKRSFEPIEN